MGIITSPAFARRRTGVGNTRGFVTPVHGFVAEREEEVHGIPVVYYARPLLPLEPTSR